MKKITTLLASAFLSTLAMAQLVTIPDVNFKAALVANLTINTNSDTEIQVSEALAYTGIINVNNMNIADLTGIEAFTSLGGLICDHNNLTVLNITANAALTNLVCDNNNLTALDVSACSGLAELRCANNSITVLNVTNNTGLLFLYCDHNLLTSLNLSANVSLTNLVCSQNPLMSLNVAVNTALTQFYCSECQLSVLNVSANTALTELLCDHNALTVLDVSTNTALNILNCGNNLLTSVDVSTNAALSEFSCNDNQLSILDVSANAVLAILDCSYSTITSLTLPANTILHYLNCGGNNLTTLTVSANTGITDLRCYENQLTSLNLTNNTALVGLHCDFNLITTLNLSVNTALIVLECQDNQLTSLNVQNGNNTNFTTFTANANPGLTCIQVDNAAYSTAAWVSGIDAGVSFSTNCNLLLDCTNSFPAMCAGGTLTIPYTASGFNSGNIFSAQISDELGSFAFPFTIGTVTSTTSGVISCSTAGFAPGTGYRIRIQASNPFVVSADNGNDIVIMGSTSYSQTITQCGGSYTIGVNSYSVSGTYQDTLTNFSGCDSLVTTNLTVNTPIAYYQDLDGDGYGSMVDTFACSMPVGYVLNNFDCNDNNYTIHPGYDICGDGVDNNCDGTMDDNMGLYLHFDQATNNTLTCYQTGPVFLNQYHQAFSVGCWFRADTGQTVWNSTLIDKHGFAGGNVGFVLRAGSGVLNFAMFDSIGTVHNLTAGSVSLHQWYYALAAFDGYSTATLYLNGLPIATDNTIPSYSPSPYDITVGHATYYVPRPFHGGIDNVSVWDHAVSQTEIINAMESDTTGGNVVFYNMETVGATAGGSNAGLTTVANANAGYEGILTNFNLSGLASNYENDVVAWYMDWDGDLYTVGNAVYGCGSPGAGYINSGMLGHDCDDNNNTITFAYNINQTFTLCNGLSLTVGINTYNTTGVYTDTLVLAGGCDSIVTTNLTIVPFYTVTQSPTLCFAKALMVGTNVYTVSGTYTDTLTAVGGCDSIVTTNLTINPVITADAGISDTICKFDDYTFYGNGTGGTGALSYVWNDTAVSFPTQNATFAPEYTTPVILTVTDQAGCSASDTVTLYVINNAEISGFVTYNGGADTVTKGTAVLFRYRQGYSQFDTAKIRDFNNVNGFYRFSNVHHHDYILKIFGDTILYPNLVPTYYGNKYMWDSATVFNQNCYTNDTAHSVIMRQDSVLHGLGHLSGTILEGMSYTRHEGEPVRGIDIKVVHNPGGAMVTHTTTGYGTNWGVYTFDSIPNGTYDVMVDIPGLHRDSVYTVTVSAGNTNHSGLDYIADTLSVYIVPLNCNVVNNIYPVQDTLFTDAVAGGLETISYQWLDCTNYDSIIHGAVNQYYHPATNGWYACRVNDGGCIDTSACYIYWGVGVGGFDESGIGIAPNPFTEQTTITFAHEQKNTTIRIVDMIGKEMKSINFSGKQLILEKGEMANGIYFLQAISENGRTVNKKIVIQ